MTVADALSRFSRVAALTVFVLLLVGPLSGAASGQVATALVKGDVTDQTKSVLPGVTITARNDDTGLTRTTVTDERGRYQIPALHPGRYSLIAELVGFARVQRTGLTLTIGQEATLNLQLQLVSVQETVTVTSEAPLVEVTKTTLGSTITAKKLDELPLQGRDYSNLVTLAAGVTPDGGTAGMASFGRNSGRVGYRVDGVSQENNLTVGSRGNLSPDSVQEFQVLTNLFNAEYGTASGPIVNILTRSGTNSIRGRAAVFARANELDARPYFATGEAPFSQQWYSGNVGGPILQDRVHYFGSIEGIRQNETAVVTSQLLPGEYPRTMRGVKFLGRLDAQFGPNNHLTYRYNIDKSTSTNQGVSGLNTIERGRKSTPRRQDNQATVTSVLSSAWLNELRVQYAPLNSGSREQNCPGCPAVTRPSGNLGKATNMPQYYDETRLQIVDTMSWTKGAHNVKMGLDYSYLWTDIFFPNTADGAFVFETDRPFDAADATTYPTQYDIITGDPFEQVPDQIVSLFVQDSWRATSNLTLNVGLRYDWQGQYGVSHDRNNFGPRFGFSWDPQGDGRLLIRGGGGLFYDRNRGELALFAIQSASNLVRTRIINPGYTDPFGPNPNGTREGAVPQTGRTVIEPNKRITYSERASIGVVKAVTSYTRMTSDFVWTRGLKVLRNRDINPVVDDATGRRVDPTQGPITQQEASANTFYYGWETELEQRLHRNLQATVGYVLSWTEHDLDNPISQLDFTEAMARAGNRHVMTGSAMYQLPWGFQLGALARARSGDYYSVLLGRDLNRDGFNTERPEGEARNGHEGPWSWVLDARVSKVVQLGASRRLELIAEAFNITNRPNFSVPENRLTSANFGRFVAMDSEYNPRQVQLGARFSF